MTNAHEAQKQRTALYYALQVQVKDKVCGACDSYPRVVWYASEWRIRCNCWPKPPTFASAFKRETRGRA